MALPYEITEVDGKRVARVVSPSPLFEQYGVPVGYECDGASIPKWLQWLCGDPFSDPRVYAAIVHDWMYDTHSVSRAEADRIYRENLIALGFGRIKANIEYSFIRVCGGSHW